MPYVNFDKRYKLDNYVNKLDLHSLTIGEMNYFITKCLLKHNDEESYTNYNNIIGLLECIKQEYYRKLVSPYEDIKEKENGEVF